MTALGIHPGLGHLLLVNWAQESHGQLSYMPDREQEHLPSMQCMLAAMSIIIITIVISYYYYMLLLYAAST